MSTFINIILLFIFFDRPELFLSIFASLLTERRGGDGVAGGGSGVVGNDGGGREIGGEQCVGDLSPSVMLYRGLSGENGPLSLNGIYYFFYHDTL